MFRKFGTKKLMDSKSGKTKPQNKLFFVFIYYCIIEDIWRKIDVFFHFVIGKDFQNKKL